MKLLTVVLLIAGSALAQQTSMVGRMMAFDKNHDGKLTRDEITDERLLALFDRADANKDGVVTKAELEALNEKEIAVMPQGRSPGGGRGGRGFGGGPQAGQVVPTFMMDRMNLTDEQRTKLQALQREVDAKLDSILTTEQRQMMKQGGGLPPPRN